MCDFLLFYFVDSYRKGYLHCLSTTSNFCRLNLKPLDVVFFIQGETDIFSLLVTFLRLAQHNNRLKRLAIDLLSFVPKAAWPAPCPHSSCVVGN